jgi:hypothetical protein
MIIEVAALVGIVRTPWGRVGRPVVDAGIAPGYLRRNRG